MRIARYYTTVSAFALTLFLVRLIELVAAYDREMNLFVENSLLRYLTWAVTAGIAAALFWAFWRTGKNKTRVVKTEVETFGAMKVASLLFLGSSSLLAMWRLYGAFVASLDMMALIGLGASILYVVYAASMLPLHLWGRYDKAMDYTLLLGAVCTIFWIFSGYIPMTEMSTVDHYMLRILAQAVLALFFLYNAKALALGSNPAPTYVFAAAFGVFAVGDLFASSIFGLLIDKNFPTYHPLEIIWWLSLILYTLCSGALLMKNEST